MTDIKTIPSVSVTYAANSSSTKTNEMSMLIMQERAYEKRGEQYLLRKALIDLYLKVESSVSKLIIFENFTKVGLMNR